METTQLHLLRSFSRRDNVAYHNYNYTLENNNFSVMDSHLDIPESVEVERVQDIVYLTLYSAIGIIALFGNSIVCKVVFCKSSMRNFTNLLLANMAISDILCAFMFPVGLLVCWDNFLLKAGRTACIIAKVIQLLSFQVSSVTMTVVAIDRFLLVYYPLVRKHRLIPVYWVMLLIWIVSLSIVVGTSPSLAFHRYFTPQEAYIKCEVALVFSHRELSAKEQRIRLILANLAHFWIPLIVITVCYSSLTWKVMRRNVGTMVPSQQEILSRVKWKTVKMLIATVAVFFICWFPFFILNFLDFFGNPERKRPCNKSGMFFIAVWFAFSSCCYNPFVYWVYSKEFRGGLKDFWGIVETFFGWSSSWCRDCRILSSTNLESSSMPSLQSIKRNSASTTTTCNS